MSEQSARLALPFLLPSQAQKHVTHNEALERLDLLVQLAVESFGATVPPAAPQLGQVWALGAGAVGAWSGQDGRLAHWTEAGWTFVVPRDGWVACSGQALRIRLAGAWVTPEPGLLQNLPGLGVNAAYDAVNRVVVAAQATLLTHDGAGHQIKINKAGPTDTASLLFQTAWGGRAEMGTTGSDDFAIKVSADGSAWHVAAEFDASSGRVTLPAGVEIAGPVTLPSASLPLASLENLTGLSVAGRSAATPGAPAPIAASADHLVLRRAGDTLGFGAVSVGQAGVLAGAVPLAHGGTGSTTAAGARTALGLGSAAVAALTSSASDITAGRVLKTGDYGLGTAQAATGSLDLVQSFGVHLLGAGVTQGPAGVSAAALEGSELLVLRQDAANLVQALFVRAATGSGRGLWLRRAIAGSWGPWSRVYDQSSVLGSVSQAAGVPTGGLIEQGTNSNGSFVRFADGTQICTRATLSVPNASTALGALFRSADLAWTYPVAFAAPPVVTGAADDLDAWLAFAPASAASVTLRALSATSKTGPLALRASAVGRWF